LNQLATITIPEARLIIISHGPDDHRRVEKAIQNPSSD